MADRFGRKPLMIAGTLLLSVTSYLNANASTFAEFIIYRFCEGAGSAMCMTSRQTLLADMLKPEERGRIMSYFQSFTLIGSAAGPTIGGFAAALWNIRAPFYFYAVAGLISLALTLVFIHEPKDVHERTGNHTNLSLSSSKGSCVTGASVWRVWQP